MTSKEFSNEFDIQYNSISSNSAPSLDLYEKSVYLSRAQLELIKNYFNPFGNKYRRGFEQSSKRRADLKELIRNHNSYHPEPSGLNGLSENSQFFKVPAEIFLIIQEQAISLDRRLCGNQKDISAPIGIPIEREVNRLIYDENTQSIGGEADTSTNATGQRIKFDYLKNKYNGLIGTAFFSVINGDYAQYDFIKTPINITDEWEELVFYFNPFNDLSQNFKWSITLKEVNGGPSIKSVILEQGVYGLNNVTQTYDFQKITIPISDFGLDNVDYSILELKQISNTPSEVTIDYIYFRKIGIDLVYPTIDPLSTSPTNEEFEIIKDKPNLKIVPKTHDEYNKEINNPFKNPNNKIAWRIDYGFSDIDSTNRVLELISKYKIYLYRLRYIKYPKPIILTNLNNLYPGENLSIDDEFEESKCELHQSIHREIIDRAVELALMDYKPDQTLPLKVRLNQRNE